MVGLFDRVAQVVEQEAFILRVVGSIPTSVRVCVLGV